MFQHLRYLLFHRHFWRHVSFNELSELYVSIMIRTMALSLIGIFIPVYLYQIGYTVADIGLYFAFLYGSRVLLDPFNASLVRRFGPKGVMRFSYLALILSLSLLLFMESYPVPFLAVALVHGYAVGCFYLPFDLEFSQIKHIKKEGRELGAAYTFRKIGGVMGPLAGGLVASYFGVEYTIFASILLLLVASIPLMLTPETIDARRNKKFEYADLLRFKKNMPARLGFGVSASGSTLIWPLFISIVVFQADNVYAGLGFVTTVSLFIAVLTAYFFGQVIDDEKGGTLLRLSSIATGFSMFVRPFVTTLGGVLAINIAFEPLSNGIFMPITKGVYDESDSVGNKRLSYLTCMLIYMHMGRVLLWLLVWFFAFYFDELAGLEIGFVVAGLGSFLIATQKFKALRT